MYEMTLKMIAILKFLITVSYREAAKKLFFLMAIKAFVNLNGRLKVKKNTLFSCMAGPLPPPLLLNGTALTKKNVIFESSLINKILKCQHLELNLGSRVHHRPGAGGLLRCALCVGGVRGYDSSNGRGKGRRKKIYSPTIKSIKKVFCFVAIFVLLRTPNSKS